MIRAYPSEPTVESGPLQLHISTNAERFGIRLYRQAATFAPVSLPGKWFAGVDAPVRDCGEPWSWPRYTVELPHILSDGAYVVQCITSDDEPFLQTPDARAGTALFVLRRERRRAVLLNLPLFTYHAYNIAQTDSLRSGEEGACLYSGYRSVSLHRPGGGTGGHTWDARNVDAYDAASPRQTFAHWDAKALSWLAANDYVFDLCTDLDLHNGRIDGSCRLLLGFGHQEYWTANMRTTVERHLARGGNVAFFSGNTAWFRIRYDAARTAITRDGRWCDDNPEEGFTGASYRFGGGWWRGARPATGYTVRTAAHWTFAGTGLRQGDAFGAAQRLIGYECDGCNPARPPVVLATASLDAWRTQLHGGEGLDGDGEVGGGAAMVLLQRGNGVVFNAASVDWPRVLANGEPSVERITRNVIDRLSAESSDPSAGAGDPS
ncbi:MAG: hypothetical protein GIX03_01655 [Candidatus Eremiobacteraeota bacterium]|nr:hypothetical protein [Candidatus Eremiobacteraeota bacterium]MBC5801723.1 hypothetical protein [Candidatus Eremiobacteraeota bacterium]MBC5822479.1 hypothetical protein [Candidatus Eremiobacteraeota bacterium]